MFFINITPIIKTPFTDVVGHIFNHQSYGCCAEFEMKMMNCLEAYGTERGKVKCKEITEDFEECSHRLKQMKRQEIMIQERQRQYKNGERSEEDRYAPPPPMGSY